MMIGEKLTGCKIGGFGRFVKTLNLTQGGSVTNIMTLYSKVPISLHKNPALLTLLLEWNLIVNVDSFETKGLSLTFGPQR